MPRKAPARPDRTYASSTNSDVVARIQKLLKIKGGHFPWATFLDEKEIRFIYDMAASAESFRDFQPTPPQAKFAISILKKLDLAKATWGSATAVKKGRGQKPPSQRGDMVARRKAKERLKKSGVAFSKTTPKDSELVTMLEGAGFSLPDIPGKAIDRLIAWAKTP